MDCKEQHHGCRHNPLPELLAFPLHVEADGAFFLLSDNFCPCLFSGKGDNHLCSAESVPENLLGNSLNSPHFPCMANMVCLCKAHESSFS